MLATNHPKKQEDTQRKPKFQSVAGAHHFHSHAQLGPQDQGKTMALDKPITTKNFKQLRVKAINKRIRPVLWSGFFTEIKPVEDPQRVTARKRHI